MGRVLEALRQKNPPRPFTVPSAPSSPSAQDRPAPVVPEEIPFIEVGGPGLVLQASPSVLRAAPLRSNARAKAHSSVGKTGLSFEPAPAGLAEPVLSPELIAQHDPDHPLSEQYAGLWQRIAAALGQGPKVVMFSAAGSVAQKTTIVLNLAITAARAESTRVGVIEIPGGTSTLARYLGLGAQPATAEVLDGKAAYESAIQNTPIRRLRVVPNDAKQEADFGRLEAILKKVRTQFDWILVDGPPIDAPQTAVLAHIADAVCAVTRQSEARRADIEQGLRALALQQVHLLGSVVIDP